MKLNNCKCRALVKFFSILFESGKTKVKVFLFYFFRVQALCISAYKKPAVFYDMLAME